MKKKDNLGFTLIEVLIALAIMAISLTAIIKATSSDVRSTKHIKDVSIAQLVAEEAIPLIQLGIIPNQGDGISQQTKMAGSIWPWKAQFLRDKNGLYRISLTVFNKNNQSISSFNGYMFASQPSGG